MVELGHFSFILGFLCALYALLQGIFCIQSPTPAKLQSAQRALYAVTLCVWLGALVLWYALFTHDFSVSYVYRNSSIDMPLVYLFAAFWSSLEGSHLLWTLILSTISTVALVSLRPRNRVMLPGLLTAFGTALSFMLLLNIGPSAPLVRMFPVGHYGNGMNALLQNPYMAAHPPSLFTGYCSLLVPFAYSWAALIHGRFSEEWLVTVRRWTLWAWAILTVGIFLGGKWAYVELGWAGYWAWDPVENSSFMPWLACTASLHSLLLLDKLGRLPRLQVFLSILAFALTFLGTFITRSGVISSVHSFAESNIGPAYLGYIVLLLLVSFLLLGFRGLRLPGAGVQNPWPAAKESSLLFTLFFLLFLLALVLVGTLLPIIVEAIRGVKISIQQPFFNAFSPWVALGLVCLLGLGNLLRWKRGGVPYPAFTLLLPFLLGIAGSIILRLHQQLDIKSTIGFMFILSAWGSLFADLVIKGSQVRFSIAALFKHNRPYLGAWIVHVGFLVAIAGFLGGYRGIESESQLKKGESATLMNYTLTNRGLSFKQGQNVKLVSARIEVRPTHSPQDAEPLALIEPTRSKYTNKDEWLNEIGVHSTFWHDVYLVLASFDVPSESVVLKMHINPTVKLVWTSLVIMVLGALVGLSHRLRSRDHTPLQGPLHPQEPGQNPSSAVLLGLIFMLGLGAMTMPFLARGDAPKSSENALFQEVGRELRCPTCQGVSILESETPQSIAMRKEVLRQIESGVPKQRILDFFQERYGEWILRQPDARSGWGFFAWLLPILGLIFGPLFLLLGIRISKRRAQQERELVKSEVLAWIKAKQTAGGGQ